MNKKSIHRADIDLGAPLQWDIYDINNQLLLRKGYVLQTEHQLEALLERGLFVDPQEYHQRRTEKHEQAPRQRPRLPSVVRLINQTKEQLEPLMHGILTGSALAATPELILAAAKAVIAAVELNPDIALAWIVFAPKTEGGYALRHCVEAAIIALLVAEGMKKSADELIQITAAALTMNVGMLSLQERLQGKAEALSDEESALIKQHPRISVELLRMAGVKETHWLNNVMFHHENLDGSGYPFGRSGKEIPENAQIISLADRYTARIAPRTYRKGILPHEALRGLLIEGGKTLEPLIAAYFIRTLGVYPPGAIVRLQNGETAVIYKRGKSGTTPIALSVLGPRGAPLEQPVRRETGDELHGIREAIALDPGEIPFSMEVLWGKEAAP